MESQLINFYNPNNIDDSTSCTFTSADVSNSNFLYDRSMVTKLTSVGSDDLTNEDWEFDFGEEKAIDLIAIIIHNIKKGTLYYWDGTGYQYMLIANLISNGSFPENLNNWSYDAFGDITAYWSSSGAVIKRNFEPHISWGLSQAFQTILGEKYYFKFSLISITATNLRVVIEKATVLGSEIIDNYYSSSGTYEGFFVATSDMMVIRFDVFLGTPPDTDTAIVDNIIIGKVCELSDNTETTNIFEVSQITTSKIKLEMETTQVADEEKSVSQLLALESIGTMNAPYNIIPYLKVKKNLKEKVDGGVDKIVEGYKFAPELEFDNLTTNDLNIYAILATRSMPFFSTFSQFSSDQDKLFFRVGDFYLFNMTNDYDPELYQGLVDKSWRGKIKLSEV